MRPSVARPLRWAILSGPPCITRSSALARNGAGLSHSSHARRLTPRGLSCRYFSISAPARSVNDADSTIYALSTASGRAAIAVVRVSGPACVPIYESLCPNKPLPQPRLAAVRTLYSPTRRPPSSNNVLDASALVLWFPGPRTVTGEDVLELHLHGGPAIVKSVLTAISRSDGPKYTVRYAEPGEFTRRAFMNNRLDLPQIEALGHTLSAETEQQRRLAVRGASDALFKRYEAWRRQLLYARGELEALIDFSEDQHFDESTRELVSSVVAQVNGLRQQIEMHIMNASKGELLRNGIKIALLGAPNAGKSSLLNRIVGREAAIVSTEEGTTRDIVDVGVDIGGWYCKLGDMAGIRSETISNLTGQKSVVIGAVEQEGIRRAKARALESDVVIVVLAVEDAGPADELPFRLAVDPEVVEAAIECARAHKRIVVAVNKSERLPHEYVGMKKQLFEGIERLFHVPCESIFKISCLNGILSESGQEDPGQIQAFLRGLIKTFEEIASPAYIDRDEHRQYDRSYWEDSLGVTHRQSSNLQRCMAQLDAFLAQADPPSSNPHHEAMSATPPVHADVLLSGASQDPETVEMEVDIVTAAEHLREAADSLAKITGRGDSGDVEDVLGVVFEKFCVGK
ncbi:mitochondrial GTPase [Aspergillus heteromorphus CBS 117.55]|uniref:Mitochondrial GTPase n=1 Tax=Aspergillus heteromorphus CBS 117.55 TaxID=1448321 RepID=A0A317WCE3_9EURO|nr:mitochondrial GTPase [Aspergillus heteromorphus CBS 117.55]PWY83037.1 mitochondrial GTPase [Aspergillus heteromorphus CBS 117.55]